MTACGHAHWPVRRLLTGAARKHTCGRLLTRAVLLSLVRAQARPGTVTTSTSLNVPTVWSLSRNWAR